MLLVFPISVAGLYFSITLGTMGSVIQNLAIAVLVPAVLCIFYRGFLRFSIKHIRGPQGSVLRGNDRLNLWYTV